MEEGQPLKLELCLFIRGEMSVSGCKSSGSRVDAFWVRRLQILRLLVSIYFVMSSERQQQDLFLARLRILDELEEDAVVVVHGAGPCASQFTFELMGVQSRVERILAELFQGVMNSYPELRVAARCLLENSREGSTPDKGLHSSSSRTMSAAVPRRTFCRR